MKATVEELDTTVRPLWNGEALYADWNGDRGEFLISGEASDQARDAIQKCVRDRVRLAIGIEDTGSTQLVWQGYAGSASFSDSGSEQTECLLTMSVDDWWGIFPGFSSFYFS